MPPPPLHSTAAAFSTDSTLPAELLPHPPCAAGPAAARLEGVNRPELLPSEPNVPVIDVAGFLTASEVRDRHCVRLRSESGGVRGGSLQFLEAREGRRLHELQATIDYLFSLPRGV